MRPRPKKHRKERTEAVSHLFAETIPENVDLGRSVHLKTERVDLEKTFSDTTKPLLAEIGCGKGAFVAGLSAARPDANILALEKVPDVLMMAMEKCNNNKCENVRFIHCDADNISQLIPEHSLDALYLNFSDPWPKARYAKRRLTHRGFLEKYKKLLKDGARIFFKTDNRPFFDFSLEEFEAAGYKTEKVTYDLHASELAATNIETEYERTFSNLGFTINYVEAFLENITGEKTTENKKYKNVLEAPFMVEMIAMTANMYRLGWDERNGGNISTIITEEEAAEYLDINDTSRIVPTKTDASYLEGKIFIVTGTGRYFKNAESAPQTTFGIIRILKGGKEAAVLWGYEGGGAPTSELPTHLMGHIERLKVDPKHRTVMHTHPASVIAMSHIHTLDENKFTKTLWRMISECIVVFPDGIGVLPWMVCGGEEIARASAEKLKQYRTVVWACHGIFGTGSSLDDAFGLIETVEKAAEIYLKIKDAKEIHSITDEELVALATAFNIKYNEDALKNS